ncbi:MAG: LptF/LptG family permease [Pseudomonadota bacterium]
MKRIERYLLFQLMRPIVGVFLVILAIVLAFFLSSYLADAVIDRLTVGSVAMLTGLRLGLFLDVLIPASILLGMVIALGRLQSGYEMTAIAAAGLGRASIVRAVVVVALIGLILVLLLSNVFRPWAYQRLYAMEGELITRVDLNRVEPGRFEIGDEQWVIFAERRSDQVLEQVLVHQRLPGYRNMLRAERLQQQQQADGTIGLLFSGNVRSYRLDSGGDRDLISHSDRLLVLFDPPAPEARNRIRRALMLSELLLEPGALEWGELQWRILSPISAVLLAFIALAMGRINPRRGQAAKVVSASLIAALYFAIVGMLANRVDAETISIWPGLFWLPLGAVPLLLIWFWSRWRGPGAPI